MMMGDDKTKIKFFTTFVKAMRRKDPQFGKGCYVDSTPLPNDITDNPFNALSCHGVASSSVQIRLALVLDELWEARHNSSYGDKILWEVLFNYGHEVVFF